MPKHYPAGAPTLATEENIARAYKYLANWSGDLGETVPTVEGLAIYLGLHRDTLYARQEFSDILAEIKQLQAHALLNNSLNGKYNPVIAKLLLSSKHGYVEKTAAATENVNTNLNQDVSDLDDDALKAKLAALRQS